MNYSSNQFLSLTLLSWHPLVNLIGHASTWNSNKAANGSLAAPTGSHRIGAGRPFRFNKRTNKRNNGVLF